VADLTLLLSDPELRRQAVEAMVIAAQVPVSAVIQGLEHPDEAVPNRVVHALARMGTSAAIPALLAALRHDNPCIRQWAVSAVGDMQGRGKDVGDRAIVDALAALLQDENADTRRSAAISLLDPSPAAAPAIPALKAAAKDPRPSVRRYATEAIRAIRGPPIEPR
jgi:HEAT repeat protein